MLNIFDDPNCDLLVIEPAGALTREDFGELARRLEARLAERGAVPGLVIHAADGFPGWDSFAALAGHLEFLREHHRLIPRIAVVGDGPVLAVAPALARHFIKTRIRHFPERELVRAKAWAATDGEHDPIEPIDGLPDHVVGCSLHRKVTARDYENVLIPALEERLERHDKVSVLFHVAADFEAFSLGAIWDDTRFGATHIGRFAKLALVSDVGWISEGTELFGGFVSGEVKVFPEAQLADAMQWVAE